MQNEIFISSPDFNLFSSFYVMLPGLYYPTKKESKIFKDMEVCILTPCQDYENPAKFTRFVANLVAYSWMNGLKVYQMGITERMVVDWARNDLSRITKNKINEYTGNKFTHLLWLDNDHTFPPDLAVRLASYDLDMVSALYFGRTPPHMPVVYVIDPKPDNEYVHFPLLEVPPVLFECDAVGFGAMLMRRDVLDRVPEPWFTIDWRAGEDIAFCVKAKKHGVHVYCDGGYKLGHLGAPPVITEQDWLKAKADNPEKYKDKVRVELIELGDINGSKYSVRER